MSSNGTKYVVAVFAILAAYFVYVWWFSPARAIKRTLGELAATLSVPPDEGDLGRVARLADLRRFFAPDVRVTLGRGAFELTSRDALLAAAAALRPPPGGWDVQFVNVQVTVDSDAAARAYITVEVNGRDPQTGERTLDVREARVTLARPEGGWAITTAESVEPLEQPTPR
jgi:hypothetical protein